VTDISWKTEREKIMKRILILALVMALILVSFSPVLAKGGGGNGGNGGGDGQGGNGNSNRNRNRNTERHEHRNGDLLPDFTVVTGLITAIEGTAEAGAITVLVYGGNDPSLHGTEIVVQTDVDTHFVLKDFGPITFDQLVVGNPVRALIGSDGIADRVTVGAEIVCIPV
jgi:hypothetical protein